MIADVERPLISHTHCACLCTLAASKESHTAATTALAQDVALLAEDAAGEKSKAQQRSDGVRV